MLYHVVNLLLATLGLCGFIILIALGVGGIGGMFVGFALGGYLAHSIYNIIDFKDNK